MIETKIREYLMQKVSAPVYLEVPAKSPSEYILIQLIDAGKVEHVDAATFSVIVRSKTLYDTALLRDIVKDALFDAISLSCISHVDQGGEIAGIDSSNKVYQYDLTFNFYYYKEET